MNNHQFSQPLVIFLHIPKTAGTTLTDVFRQQYSKQNTLFLQGKVEEEIDKFKLEYTDNIQLVKGHMTFGLHSFLDRPYVYFTMLRDPVKRFISVYFYLLNSKKHPQHHLVENKSLDDFAISNTAHNNSQTRFIAGSNLAAFSESQENILARAKKNLKESFALVGLTEKFDETLILLKRELGWSKMPVYVQENTRKNHNQYLPSAKTLSLIQDCNALDMEIYEYAKELFMQKLNDQDLSFEKELILFKQLNNAYNPIGQVYSRLRSLTLKLMGKI